MTAKIHNSTEPPICDAWKDPIKCVWVEWDMGVPGTLKRWRPPTSPRFRRNHLLFLVPERRTPAEKWGKYFKFLPGSVFGDVPVLFLAPPSHTFILRVMIQKLWKLKVFTSVYWANSAHMWQTYLTPVNTSEAVCERNDSFCKYSLIGPLCSYEQKKVIRYE